jgi:vacuolar-type H+-ATPase subunit I/STV1
MLPMREHYREDLTTKAVKMTKLILALIVGLILLSFGGVLVLERFSRYGDLTGAFGLTVGSVAFAGIVGGCVSMLQRIQSAPSEGDALFNLASLTVGWRGLSLSPLYGGIFASLLFILFAAGILQGSIFPKIETATNIEFAGNSAAVQPAPADQPAPVASPTSADGAVATPSPLTDTQKIGILQIKDFLKETGPKDGVSFALLIIWSFIAGFAERLVPDTLNRLVAKNEAIQGTNT